MKYFINLIFSAGLILPLSCFAQDDLQERFSTAYADYQELYSNKNSNSYVPALEKAAHEAWLTGRELLNNEASIAALAMNYINESTDFQEGEKALEFTQQMYERLYEDDALEWIDLYMTSGNFFVNHRKNTKARKAFDNALEIGETNQFDLFQTANLEFEAGEAFYRQGEAFTARDMFKSAAEHYYASNTAIGYIGMTRANIRIAALDMARNRYKGAEEALLAVTDMYGGGLIDTKTAQVAFTSLSHLYIQTDEPEKLDSTLISLGSVMVEAADSDVSDYLPVITLPPKYPARAQRLGQDGLAHTRFSVDTTGRVIDVEIVEIEGDKSFGDVAMVALEGFRFVPRFKNGEPVVTEGVEYVFTFRLD